MYKTTKLGKKKFLLGLALSLVLAMAIGSFALGETPANPQGNEPQATTTNDDTCDFVVDGDAGEYSFDSVSGVLTIHGTHTISMATGKTTTVQRIYVDDEATITLKAVTIETGNGPALEIKENGSFNVKILLENFRSGVRTTGSALKTTADGCAGLQKNGGSGTLTIGAVGEDISSYGTLVATGGDNGAGIGGGNGKEGSNIKIVGGRVAATGGNNGAGIGGGNGGNGSDIEVTGGAVDATGGSDAAGIGGGATGTGSGNSLNGDGVVSATSGSSSREPFDGFTFSHGILFSRKGSDGTWNDGEMKGDVTVIVAQIPANLTVAEGQTLEVKGSISAAAGAKIYNKGTLSSSDFILNSIETYVTFYNQDGSVASEGYQTYGSTYTNVPDGSGITNFDGWYTKEDKKGGQRIAGDTGVLLNEHKAYVHLKGVPFVVEDGDADTDYTINNSDKTLKILTGKEMTVKHADGYSGTDWRIVIDPNNTEGANVTLDNINIETDYGAAFEIPDDYDKTVTITLADDSVNTLKCNITIRFAAKDPSSGIQKNGDVGNLIIKVPTDSQKKNGKLTAIGGLGGAGIGGGSGKNGKNIEIAGGEVTAIGGESASGIGGGEALTNMSTGELEGGEGSNIKITGGIVTATGGDYGAGIGGGQTGNGSNITISGGEVIATGKNGGAGIGGGQSQSNVMTGEIVGGDGTDITITGGTVTANGSFGAGIGGGGEGEGNNITVSGGVVTATGGHATVYDRRTGTFYPVSGAGIGGGLHTSTATGGTASGNHLSGNAIVFAASGGEDTYSTGGTKEALQGFDAASQGSKDGGIAFTGVVTAFDTDGKTTEVNWDESGMDYCDSFTISQNIKFPANFTIGSGKELTVETGVTLTLPAGVTLQNEGTLSVKKGGSVDCQYDEKTKDSGKITTKFSFYNQDGTSSYKDGYQIYMTSAGVQKYKDFPNIDNSTIRVWYTEKGGSGTRVSEKTNVLLNTHECYEYMTQTYAISIDKQGEGEIKTNVTEAAKDDEVTFTATPAEGYELKEGSVKVTDKDGKEVTLTEKDGKYIFTMPGSEVTVSAVFEQIPEPTPTPPTPTPPEPGPEPTPTPEPTPDPSVDPDSGDGSGNSSKTSDQFMGGVALALLGVATTGAVLVHKRK